MDRLKNIGGELFLGFLVLVVFGQAVTFGLIDTWDDSIYFLVRPEVVDWWSAAWNQRLRTPRLGYPVPIPTFLYALVRELPADWVVPTAHGVNVGFHLIAVILLYRLLGRWLDHRGLGLFCAAIWAVHPVQVESVAWVTNLKFVTVAALGFGAMVAWERFLDDMENRRGYAVLSVVLVLTALGCQPVALGFGPALAMQTAFRLDRSQWTRSEIVVPLGILAVLSAAYIPVALMGQHAVVKTAAVPGIEVEIWQRVLRIGAAFYLQIRHIFLPVDLHPVYDVRPAEMLTPAIFGFGFMAILLAATVVAAIRRHPAGFFAALAWLFYLPASGIDFMPRLTADPYAYLPLAFLAVAIVSMVRSWLGESVRRWKLLTAVLGGILVLTLTALSFVQAQRWRNAVTLLGPVTERYIEAPIPHGILGQAYAKIGEHEKAIEVWERGFEPLYAHGYLPLEFITSYLAVGRPDKAANMAMIMATYRGRQYEELHPLLLEIVVGHAFPLPPSGQKRRDVREALRRAMKEVGPHASEAFLGKAVEYFRSQSEPGLEELSRHYLQERR